MNAIPFAAGDLFEALPLPATLVDREGRIAGLNQAFLDYARQRGRHLRLEDRLGFHVLDFAGQGEEHRLMQALLREALEEGRQSVFTWASQRTSGGRRVYINVRATPIRDQEGRISGALILREDTTELKRAEEEQARLEAQLQQMRKLEAVGQLSAGVAHNFNNILQVIMGNIELALLDAPEALRFPLQEAELATRRGAEVVRQLAAFTRAPRQGHHAAVDLRAVLDRVVARCRQAFDPRIALRLDAPPSLVIAGETSSLEQVCFNLCLNARDAVEEHRPAAPVIHLDLRQVQAAELAPPPPPEAGPGPYAQLQVADNGAGMDEATRERIFEPFFTTKEVGKGTGLGLATAYGIVREHQGWIECQSAPGTGACFRVFLPLGHPRREPEPAPPGGQTVLLVEDESLVRETVAEFLRRAGYRVCEAGDGVEGLELLEQLGGRVDLVLLDLAMPRLSGEEMLARLGELAPQLKVVLFTGYGEDWQGSPQVVEVLRKPLQFAEILETVRRVLAPEPS
jgi:PAS domain S-box-containing protein